MIEWRAPEFVYHEKDVSWYWLVVIAAIVITAIALWQRNFLFAVFTIIAAITLVAWGRRRPRTITITLDEKGVTIDGIPYPKEDYSHFMATEHAHAGWSRLVLKAKSKFGRRLVLPVPHQEFDTVKKQCLHLWTETELHDSLVDELSDFFRF